MHLSQRLQRHILGSNHKAMVADLFPPIYCTLEAMGIVLSRSWRTKNAIIKVYALLRSTLARLWITEHKKILGIIFNTQDVWL